MERQKAIERIAQLRDTLWECNRRYYVDNAPSVSDYEYDMMMNELIALEKEHPDLVTPDSPTQKVGSDLESEAAAARQARSESGENAEWGAGREFRQVRHKHPMLSLGNTYSISEVEEFAQRAAKTIGGEFTYSCELKFDGTAICLTYRDGKLYQALTRGDGLVGDDVTANARMISNIPHVLKGKGWPSEFEIRGEVLMPYASFDALNRERELDEDPPFANPRNAASGSLKLLDSAEVGRRGLMCTLYHIPDDSIHFPTHSEALDAAASWGLPVSDKRKIAHGIDEIEQYISYWDTERKNLPYATDGIVIKINETPLQKALGFTSKFPRWAVAYKFKAEDALTRLVSIDYQVGRTGAVTPVANLEPVLLSGTMVKRATLNNADQMALLDIRVGGLRPCREGRRDNSEDYQCRAFDASPGYGIACIPCYMPGLRDSPCKGRGPGEVLLSQRGRVPHPDKGKDHPLPQPKGDEHNCRRSHCGPALQPRPCKDTIRPVLPSEDGPCEARRLEGPRSAEVPRLPAAV